MEDSMKLKNILIVVNNIEESRKFYRDLFGLETILNCDGNVILTEGLVLQEREIWKNELGKEIVSKNHASELYFEEKNIEEFEEKLKRFYPFTEYVTQLTELSWGQKMLRFYDLDGNLIEVRTPMS